LMTTLDTPQPRMRIGVRGIAVAAFGLAGPAVWNLRAETQPLQIIPLAQGFSSDHRGSPQETSGITASTPEPSFSWIFYMQLAHWVCCVAQVKGPREPLSSRIVIDSGLESVRTRLPSLTPQFARLRWAHSNVRPKTEKDN
jgi:hypothetical protein